MVVDYGWYLDEQEGSTAGDSSRGRRRKCHGHRGETTALVTLKGFQNESLIGRRKDQLL